MVTGGVYLGGGIAPRIILKLKEPVFMNAFTAKGRLRPLLKDIPVRVIMNPKTALLGAARHTVFELAQCGKDKYTTGHYTRSRLKVSRKGNYWT